MTIKNYTFFSPTGTEYPVTSNADAKLYMMLGNMSFDAGHKLYRDWVKVETVGLNIVFKNTSIIAGGRYIELIDHVVQLAPSTTNYLHVRVTPSDVNNPVMITADTAIHNEGVDINNESGTLVIPIRTANTDSATVLSTSTYYDVQRGIYTNGKITAPELTVSKTAILQNVGIQGNISLTGDTVGLPTESSTWTWNSAWYRVKMGVLYLHIEGARPKASLSSPTYPIVGSIPKDIADRMIGNVNFRWSNYSGGGTTYGGRLEQGTGNIVFYLFPAGTIATNHRFSVDLAFPLKDV